MNKHSTLSLSEVVWVIRLWECVDEVSALCDIDLLVCITDRLSVSSGQALLRAENVWGALRGMVGMCLCFKRKK